MLQSDFIALSALPVGVYVLLGFGLLYVLVRWDERRENEKEKRLGYRILRITSGQLRGDDGEWALEYREKGQSLYFTGREVKKRRNTLNMPSAEHWDESVPKWAQGRREEILRRVRATEAAHYFVIREI